MRYENFEEKLCCYPEDIYEDNERENCKDNYNYDKFICYRINTQNETNYNKTNKDCRRRKINNNRQQDEEYFQDNYKNCHERRRCFFDIFRICR